MKPHLKIRQIVEQIFAWLDKNRQLSKNYERLFKSTKMMIIVGFCSLKWGEGFRTGSNTLHGIKKVAAMPTSPISLT